MIYQIICLQDSNIFVHIPIYVVTMATYQVEAAVGHDS